MTTQDMHLKSLIQRMDETQKAIQTLLSGQADAVISPASGITTLLPESQAALLSNKKWFHQVYNAIPCGVMVEDGNETIIYANSMARMFLGALNSTMSADQSREDWTAFREDGAPLAWEEYPARAVLRSGGAKDMLVRVVAPKTGETRWLRASSQPLDNPPSMVLTTLVDVSPDKQAEAKTRAEQQQLQAVVDLSPVAVLAVKAANGTLLFANREARVIGAVNAQEHVLFPDAIAFHLSNGERCSREDMPLAKALKLGVTVRTYEVTIEFPDGRKLPVLMSATPVRDLDNHITAAILVVEDVSRLEEVDKLRNEFLGMVSHELRTPLAILKMAASSLLEIDPSEVTVSEALEALETVNSQADRLASMVSNLRDVVQIEAGAFSMDPKPTDLIALLNQAREHLAASGGAQIEVRVRNLLPTLHIDARRILQVMENLLDNAVRFSNPQSPVVVEVEASDEAVTVHVKNRGQGIPTEKQTHLFKKFAQLDGPHRRGPGMGVGLAICKGIVEGHGGRIWVRSSANSPVTTFSFSLPVAEHLAASPQRDPEPPKNADAQATRVVRVLAVDDEPQILTYVERALERGGYQAIVTMDPNEVSSLVEQEAPDLLLLDLMLPETTGFEILEQVRKISDLPVIFLSAADSESDKVRALRMGAEDYITKPFSPAELMARIEVALRRSRAA